MEVIMEKPDWATKNPLGILALFIFLIYSVSALLFGLSADELGARHKEIVIWFITVFPLFVLVVFYLLVSRHHTKLYAPTDYQQPGEFGRIAAAQDSKRVGSKFSHGRTGRFRATAQDGVLRVDGEMGPPASEDIEQGGVQLMLEGGGAGHDVIMFRPEMAFGNAMVRAFVAETLVFQDLQERFQGAVLRNVRFTGRGGGSALFDGLIESQANQYLVDVTFVMDRAQAVGESVQMMLDRLAGVAPRQEWPALRSVLVYDLGLAKPEAEQRESLRATYADKGVELMFYDFSELVEKFGFTL